MHPKPSRTCQGLQTLFDQRSGIPPHAHFPVGRLLNLRHEEMLPFFRVAISGCILRAMGACRRKHTCVLSVNSITSAVNSSSSANRTCLITLPTRPGYSIEPFFIINSLLQQKSTRKPFNVLRSCSSCRVCRFTLRRKSSACLNAIRFFGPKMSMCRLVCTISFLLAISAASQAVTAPLNCATAFAVVLCKPPQVEQRNCTAGAGLMQCPSALWSAQAD